MFELLSNLKDFKDLKEITNDFPQYFPICYYERFRRYGLTLEINDKELSIQFVKVIDATNGFRQWENVDSVAIDLQSVDLSNKRVLKKQMKDFYKTFIKKLKSN